MNMIRKTLRKFALTFLAAALLGSMIPVTAFASSDEPKDYTIDTPEWTTEGDPNDNGYGPQIAEWAPASDKTTYRVNIYKTTTYPGDKTLTELPGDHVAVRTVSKPKLDCSTIIRDNGYGYYRFEVYPVKGGRNMTIQSAWLKINKAFLKNIKKYIKDKNAEAASETSTVNGWSQNGPLNKWIYRNADTGKYVTNSWLKVDGKWYLMDPAGYMVTGWQKVSGYWYHLDETSGELSVSTVVDGRTVDENGAWVEKGERVNASGGYSITAVEIIGEKKAAAQESAADTSESAEAEAGAEESAAETDEVTADEAPVVKLPLSVTDVDCGEDKIRNINFRASKYYTLEESSTSIPYEQWNISTSVNLVMKIKAKKGCYFDDNTQYTCGLGDITSNTGDKHNREITVNFTPRIQLAMPTNVYVDSSGTLKWTGDVNADRYLVIVKKNGGAEKTKYTSGNTYDLSEYMGESGYSVSVAAYGPKKMNHAVNSKAYEIADLLSYMKTQENGTFKMSGGKPVYTNNAGQKVTGWQYLGEKWYHFNDSGVADGPGWWQDSDGTWYYFDSQSAMVTGELTVNDQRCFFNDGSVDGYKLGAWIENYVFTKKKK